MTQENPCPTMLVGVSGAIKGEVGGVTLQFPTTPEAFTDVQAQLMGEPVGANLQEPITAWTPIFNDCFQAGLRGDRAELDAYVDHLDELDPGIDRLDQFLRAARAWMIAAWEQGRGRSKTA